MQGLVRFKQYQGKTNEGDDWAGNVVVSVENAVLFGLSKVTRTILSTFNNVSRQAKRSLISIVAAPSKNRGKSPSKKVCEEIRQIHKGFDPDWLSAKRWAAEEKVEQKRKEQQLQDLAEVYEKYRKRNDQLVLRKNQRVVVHKLDKPRFVQQVLAKNVNSDNCRSAELKGNGKDNEKRSILEFIRLSTDSPEYKQTKEMVNKSEQKDNSLDDDNLQQRSKNKVNEIEVKETPKKSQKGTNQQPKQQEVNPIAIPTVAGSGQKINPFKITPSDKAKKIDLMDFIIKNPLGVNKNYSSSFAQIRKQQGNEDQRNTQRLSNASDPMMKGVQEINRQERAGIFRNKSNINVSNIFGQNQQNQSNQGFGIPNAQPISPLQQMNEGPRMNFIQGVTNTQFNSQKVNDMFSLTSQSNPKGLFHQSPKTERRQAHNPHHRKRGKAISRIA